MKEKYENEGDINPIEKVEEEKNQKEEEENIIDPIKYIFHSLLFSSKRNGSRTYNNRESIIIYNVKGKFYIYFLKIKKIIK